MSHTNRAIRSVFKSRAHMEVLVVVADTGSMSAAAKALHTTQPVVTNVIKNLEAEAGSPLFERRGSNGSLPTALGDYAVALARTMLHDMKQGDHALEKVRKVLHGTERPER